MSEEKNCVPFDVETFKELWVRLAIVETTDKALNDRINYLSDHILKLEERKAEASALQEATKLAKENVDARLSMMNEFREQIKDQTSTFLPRQEYIVQHSSLEQRIVKQDEDVRGLRESRATMEGKASQTSVLIGYAIAIAAIILSLFALIH